jgi:hypothetical protein
VRTWTATVPAVISSTSDGSSARQVRGEAEPGRRPEGGSWPSAVGPRSQQRRNCLRSGLAPRSRPAGPRRRSRSVARSCSPPSPRWSTRTAAPDTTPTRDARPRRPALFLITGVATAGILVTLVGLGRTDDKVAGRRRRCVPVSLEALWESMMTYDTATIPT